MPLKSSFVKVMGGILGRNATAFTLCTARRCFFFCVVGASYPSEAADYGVDNLSITSSVGLPRGSSLQGGSSLLGCRLSQ